VVFLAVEPVGPEGELITGDKLFGASDAAEALLVVANKIIVNVANYII